MINFLKQKHNNFFKFYLFFTPMKFRSVFFLVERRRGGRVGAANSASIEWRSAALSALRPLHRVRLRQNPRLAVPVPAGRGHEPGLRHRVWPVGGSSGWLRSACLDAVGLWPAALCQLTPITYNFLSVFPFVLIILLFIFIYRNEVLYMVETMMHIKMLWVIPK